MKNKISFNSIFSFSSDRLKPFLLENKKIIAQFTFSLLFIGLGIWFLKHERAELIDVKKSLIAAKWQWVFAGLLITAIYIFLQGQMYVFSFASLKKRISLSDSVILFIKRNLISIFLPAGGISSLAFFTGKIESKGITKSQIHFASSIYGFIGILSVVIVAIPAFIYELVVGTVGWGEWYALITVGILLILLYLIYKSIISKGYFYQKIVKLFPSTEVFLSDLQNNEIDKKKFLFTIITSVIIEFIGILHLYVAQIALGFDPSMVAAIMGYIISVIFLIVSPFLRGFGAIEISMAYILTRFGFNNVDAIAITFLYRFFEFWMPLFIGVLAFVSKLNKLIMRVFPAFFLMMLGIINIVSVLTPAISERLTHLKSFMPMEIIQTSNYLVLIAGIFLLVTSAFMLKGLRTAWWFAFVLTLVSFMGHITKAIDYEEATLALLVIVILIATHKQYYIKSNPKLRNVGIQTSVLFTVVVLLYGIIGFYFLDKKHFNNDFSLFQSIRFTIQNYFLIGSSDINPADSFARHFLYSINISGFLSITFLIYTFLRTYSLKNNIEEEELLQAKKILQLYGNSPIDYFKIYSDKLIFLSQNQDAFIAYRVSGNFAVVLGTPVSENENTAEECIKEFDSFCYENGMKSIYYRVPEESLEVYQKLRKKSLFIGQEGVIDLSTFSLEGKKKKSMRNAINKVIEQDYKSTVHNPPIKDGVIQKLKLVSQEWLADMGRSEIVFSQGMFVWEELKQQTIITVENEEEKIVAFLNIIPDYVKGEATYDLIRKTKDAPNGVIDFILIEFFNYVKSIEYEYVNMGFAPLSGLNDPHTFPEKSMKFAYEKIRSFSHYKGMRDYKDKFEPVWYNKYLIYQHDYDLLQIPTALTKVIKP